MTKPVLLLFFALNFALANLTSEGQTTYDAGDEQTAAQIWQKACEIGEARGCVRLGFLYKNGKGVEQDDAKASKFYEKACDAGELSGCDSLASLHQNSGEHAKAAVIFDRACEKGFGLSCYNLAQIYEAGVGVAPDESKALELYVKACERGYAVVCYYLGGMYADGAMGKNDEAAKNSKTRSNFTHLPARVKFTKRARLWVGFTRTARRVLRRISRLLDPTTTRPAPQMPTNAAAASVWTSYTAAGLSIKAGSLRQPTS